MKKVILLIFAISAISFSAETDGIGGASLNPGQVMKKFKELSVKADKAVKADDWFLKESTSDEIEGFIEATESYDGVSSPSAKRNVAKMNKVLKAKLAKLQKVDGVGGASLDPQKVMPRYSLVSKLLDKAIKTGEGKAKATKEANDLLAFIGKWKGSQSEESKKNLSKFESSINEKLKKL